MRLPQREGLPGVVVEVKFAQTSAGPGNAAFETRYRVFVDGVDVAEKTAPVNQGRLPGSVNPGMKTMKNFQVSDLQDTVSFVIGQ